MISISKFASLKEQTGIKKASVIVSSKIHDKKDVLDSYSLEMYDILKAYTIVDAKLLDSLISRVKNGENPLLIAEYLKALSGLGDASWDYIKGENEDRKRDVRDFYLVLDHIRSPYNLGAIFRSSESFGVKKIYIIGNEISLSHPRAIRTSAGTIEMVDSEVVEEDEIIDMMQKDKDASVFSLECGGESLNNFNFPSKGYCIVGNEEFGISKKLLSLSKNIVTIQTGGLKGSINVSVAVGILLNSWYNF